MNKTSINKLILLGTFSLVFSFAHFSYAANYPVCPMNNVTPNCVVSFNDKYHTTNYVPEVVNQNSDYYNSGYDNTNNTYPYNNQNQYNSYSSNNTDTNNVPTVNNANGGSNTVSSNTVTPTRVVAVSTAKKTTTVATTTSTNNTRNVDNVNTTNTTSSNTSNGLSANAGQAFGYNTSNTTYSNNGLTALTWFGNPGFLPNTIFEWILAVFFILILIILIRQFRPKHVHEAHPTAVHH